MTERDTTLIGPELTAVVKRHVVLSNGKYRSNRQFVRLAVIEKLKAENVKLELNKPPKSAEVQ